MANKLGELQGVKPTEDRIMKTWFDLVEMQLDLSLEFSLPRAHAWRSSVENDSIPFIPEAPGSNQEYFHEERVLKGIFGSVNPFI